MSKSYFAALDFSQYRQEMPMYAPTVDYQSEMYGPYNPAKNYSKPTEYQYEYPSVASTSAYTEPGIRNFGLYNKEMEAGNSPSQINYARGFAQTPYSGFYSEPSFGIVFANLS